MLATMARTPHSFSRAYVSNELVDRFTAEYIANGGNGAAAVRVVIPSDARSGSVAYRYASHLRRHPRHVERMAEQERASARAVTIALERYGVTAERAAEEMARLAFTELRQVVDWSTVIDPKTKARRQVVRVRDAAEIDPDAHKALTKITTKADGSVVIELADKRAAIMDLARLKGWIADKPEGNTQAVSFVIQR